MIRDFLNEMARYKPRHSRLMACSFRGDPNDDIKGKWVAFPLTSLGQLDPAANIYVTVSAMQRNGRGEFRRRKENFCGGLLLMIDDLGTGPGAKFAMDIIDPLPPTCLIETSPDNFQAVYMFNRLVTDMGLFERLIKGFIEKEFLGKDTGMAGVNRVFRPPFGVNGKAKYGGWTVRGSLWAPANRYSPERIAKAFEINIKPPPPKVYRGATADKAENIKRFVQVRSALRSMGMLKRANSDLAGWQDVVCPWTDDHTGGVDNGAAICEPNEENNFNGGFKCHHGGCEGRGWRELTEWINENEADILAEINKQHFNFEEWKNDRRATNGDGRKKERRLHPAKEDD